MKIIREDPAQKVPPICEKDAHSYAIILELTGELTGLHERYIAKIRKSGNHWDLVGGRFPNGSIVRWLISDQLDNKSFLEVLIRIFKNYQDNWDCTVYILDDWQQVVKLLGGLL